MAPFDGSWLIATVALAAPLIFAALGELISERSGVLNVGLEGFMTVGAFAAFLTTWKTGCAWAGVVAGVLAATSMASIVAAASIDRGGDQIVAGLGVLILGSGLTTYANQQIFTGHATVEPMQQLRIPGLAELPWIGTALFDQSPLAYLAYICVPLVYVLLWRTPWGLWIRACGEDPGAVEAAGLSVRTARWAGTLAAGAGGGFAGALLSVGSLGIFSDGTSNGRGFIALAAVVFGRWRPFPILAACLVFGGADALQLRLQALGQVPRAVWLAAGVVAIVVALERVRRDGKVLGLGIVCVIAGALFATAPAWQLPAQIWLMLPYVTTILVLAGVLGRARAPSALGTHYRRTGSE